MSLSIECLTVDCEDPDRLATFWAAALGWRLVESDEEGVMLGPADGGLPGAVPGLLLLRVAEAKLVKNRLHLDLRPTDQAAEVARLEALGARRTAIGQGDEVTWVVMADPEGNELCVLRTATTPS